MREASPREERPRVEHEGPVRKLTFVVHATLRRGVEPRHDDTRIPTPRRIDDVKRQDHDG